MHGGTEVWAHNPIHRRGVAYHNPETARRFGQTERSGVAARKSFRGFAPEGRVAGIGTSPTQRPNTGRQTTQPRRIGTNSRQSVQSQRGHAFESFGSSGREVTQHSERGNSSIGGSGRGSGVSHGGTGGGSHGGDRVR
jgi:hypothetical protein